MSESESLEPKQGEFSKKEGGFYYVFDDGQWVNVGKYKPVNSKPDFERLLQDSWDDNEELYRALAE